MHNDRINAHRLSARAAQATFTPRREDNELTIHPMRPISACHRPFFLFSALMQHAAPLDLRVNLLKGTREPALGNLYASILVEEERDVKIAKTEAAAEEERQRQAASRGAQLVAERQMQAYFDGGDGP